MVPVMIRSLIYLNNNAFASFYTHFEFSFCLIINITHVSFEALKCGFAIVLVSDATSHGIRKPQFFPSNSLRKELSNDIWFAYIVLTPVSSP